MEESTLFIFETNTHTYYVDYNNGTGNYSVFKDEKFYFVRKDLGECLKDLFNKLGVTKIKAIR